MLKVNWFYLSLSRALKVSIICEVNLICELALFENELSSYELFFDERKDESLDWKIGPVLDELDILEKFGPFLSLSHFYLLENFLIIFFFDDSNDNFLTFTNHSGWPESIGNNG